MKAAVYPGSFDPITLGHLDIIDRAASIFDFVIVAVCVNSDKLPLFSMEERMKMIAHDCKHLNNIEVKCFYGLLSDFVQQEKAEVIVRGLRAISDFENEFQMALMNRKLNPEADTFFLVSNPKYSYLSSSIVKEIASFGGDVDGFVSAHVAGMLKEKFRYKLSGNI